MIGSEITFHRLEFSPSVAAGLNGVTLAANATPKDDDSFSMLKISIAYQIDELSFSELKVKTPMEAVVLTCVSGSTVYSKNVMGDLVPFEDDFLKKKGVVAGYLNFRLASHVDLNVSFDLYVTVSLGGFLSNTLTFPKQVETK